MPMRMRMALTVEPCPDGCVDHAHLGDMTLPAVDERESLAASLVAAYADGGAEQAMRYLAAAADDVPVADLPDRWHGILTVEGLQTSDGRIIHPDALSWRQLPIALMAQFLNDGHLGAPIVGTVDTIDRVQNGSYNFVQGAGTFALDLPDGRQAALMVRDQVLRWGSIDMEILDYDELWSPTGEYDDWGDPVFQYLLLILEARIAGFTLVPMPAFPQAVVAPETVALDPPEPMGDAMPDMNPGLVAATVTIDTPPHAWFNDPRLPGPTPLTVTSDGRVYGHAALWDTCHSGFADRCVVPPRSAADYAFFLTGQVETAEGDLVRVGPVTLAGGHAPSRANAARAIAHYDDTASAVADVAVGEDAHGLWVAGALRAGVTGDQVRTLRASPLSGDWRTLGGGLELVALLAVNTPGFPIVASAVDVHGDTERVLSLVASFAPDPSGDDDVRRTVADLRARQDTLEAALLPLVAERLVAAIGEPATADA